MQDDHTAQRVLSGEAADLSTSDTHATVGEVVKSLAHPPARIEADVRRAGNSRRRKAARARGTRAPAISARDISSSLFAVHETVGVAGSTGAQPSAADAATGSEQLARNCRQRLTDGRAIQVRAAGGRGSRGMLGNLVGDAWR